MTTSRRIDWRRRRDRGETSSTIPSRRTVGWNLFVLVAVSVVPVLLFGGFVVNRFADAQRAGYRTQIQATAHALSHAMERDLASAIGFESDRLARILREQPTPPGWIVYVVDRSGALLAHSAHSDLISDAITADDVQGLPSEGAGAAARAEALPMQAAIVRSSLSDWTTVVAVETATLDVPLSGFLRWLAGAAIFLVFSTSCISISYGRRITRSVSALTRMAAALSRGECLEERRLGLPEAQVVADQMRRTSLLLKERDGQHAILLATLEQRVADRTRALAKNEKRHRHAAARLKAASETKSRFLASVSHELRTPLSIVIGFAELMIDSRKDPPTAHQREFLGHIQQAGRQLLGLINDVLDLARIESGRLKVSIERVSLQDVIATCVALLRPMAEKNGIAIQIRPWRVQSTAIRADRARLLQVLLNLGSNAIKYNRPGGVVIIEVGRARSGRIRISINDTGIGIPAKRQPEVFELFNRLDAEDSRVEGTGIGLAISKRLVDRMRGHIGFASDPGWGSRFWVEFRAADRAPKSPAIEKMSAAATDLPPCTVLHIDDNPVALTLAAELFQSAPAIRTLTASTGETGVALAIAHQPDLIVTDIRLPDISGYEVLRRLKATSQTRNIPVLALSAKATVSDVTRGNQAGFAHYMTKPFAVDELLRAMRQAIQARAA